MYMLYCYTGGCIKHETLQTCSILRLHYIVNSATGALVQPLHCIEPINKHDTTSPIWQYGECSIILVGSCDCVVNSIQGIICYGLGKH